jgi:hypothetical protein
MSLPDLPPEGLPPRPVPPYPVSADGDFGVRRGLRIGALFGMATVLRPTPRRAPEPIR